MDSEPLHHLLRSLRHHAGVPASVPAGDAELVARFLASRDEAAFELLLWRHGPAVLGVCRRLLSNAADVEDVFQATFLALSHKAHSLRQPGVVGGWLYRIAFRLALRARAEMARRARRERSGVEQLSIARVDPTDDRDLREVLDEEVNGLPRRCQAAFVLCCVEGLTTEEAARQLGCPPGTVSSRVTRARQQLRRRLRRRGLAPTAGVLAAVLADKAWAVPVHASLVGSTVSAALLFSAGRTAGGALSPRAVHLAQGVLRAMLATQCKLVGLLLVVLSALALGGIFTHHLLHAAPPEVETNKVVERPPPRKDGPEIVDKPALEIKVIAPRVGRIERTTRESCEVQAAQREDVFAAVSGVLKGELVEIGTFVKKGQVLAEIEAPLLTLTEKQAQIAVLQAQGREREGKAQVKAAQAEFAAAEAVIDQRKTELDNADTNLKFSQNLLEQSRKLADQGAVPLAVIGQREESVATARAQLASAKATLANARAELETRRSRVLLGEAGLDTLRPGVEEAQIALEKVRYTLSLTRVQAPIDGVVTRRNYTSGGNVRATEQGERLPLYTVERVDAVRVVAQVADRDIPFVEAGAPVTLTVDALAGMRLSGYKVSRTSFVADAQTHTMRVEIDIPNPKGALRPGMSGLVTIQVQKGTPQSLWLPGYCLTGTSPGEGQVVYVVRDGKAVRTPVQTGAILRETVEIVSGLKPADVVAAEPGDLTGDVVPVKVRE